MSFPLLKYWLIILFGFVAILLCITVSVPAAQYYVSLEETSGFTAWLSKLFTVWLTPLAVPISASATFLIVLSTIMIIRNIRKDQRRRTYNRIRTWASDAITLLISPIPERSLALQVKDLEARFQAIKAEGLKALADSEKISRELDSKVFIAVTSILRFTDAFAEVDITFNFQKELHSLWQKLRDVVDCATDI